MIASAQRTARTMAGIDPYTGNWSQKEVLHLLRRTMFGATKSDIDYFVTKNMSDAVDELLSPTSFTPDPPVNNYNNGKNHRSGYRFRRYVGQRSNKSSIVQCQNGVDALMVVRIDVKPRPEYIREDDLVLAQSLCHGNTSI